MEIVETSKGKPLGLYKGYQFRQYRSNNDVVTWLCLNEKTSKCKGRMTTKNGEILKFIEHTCKPDITKCEIKKHMSIARKRAREEILPIAQIYKEEVEKLFNKGQQFIADVPLYSSVKSSLYRVRRDKQGETNELKKNTQNITFDTQFLKMTNTPSFLFDDIDERLIIFASKKRKGTNNRK